MGCAARVQAAKLTGDNSHQVTGAQKDTQTTLGSIITAAAPQMALKIIWVSVHIYYALLSICRLYASTVPVTKVSGALILILVFPDHFAMHNTDT